MMTDLTGTFISGPSDEANARSFADTIAAGSDDATRLARENASQLSGMLAKFAALSPRLWAAMQDDMRSLIDEARAARGYADMADLTRAGYSDDVVTAYLRANNPEQRQGDAA